MKKIKKKIVSILLVLTMIITQVVTFNVARAESGNINTTKGTIKIDNAIVDKTYTIYRIFDLESYSYDKNDSGNIINSAYAYKVTVKWTNFINQNEIKGTYVNVDEDGYVTWIEGAKVEDFAKKAIAYAKEKNITNDGKSKATTKTLIFDKLTLGYYLVDSTVGTLCSLDTTNKDVVIKEKNSTPTIDKQVNNNGKWDKESNAKIGDKVEYKVVITVKEGAENYTLTDIMTEGLTPNKDIIVKIGTKVVDPDNYLINYKNNGFVLSFKNEYIKTLATSTSLEVTYSATLNEKALICKVDDCKHNDNKTYLTYGDETDSSNKTPESETKTYSYMFNLIKTKSDKTELAGAEFLLYDAKKKGNVIKVYKVDTNTYRVAKTEEELAKAETIKVGNALIEGLDSNTTYYLEEIVNPEGYNKLTSRVAVKIKPTVKEDNITKIELTKIEVINYSGSELPSTGGIGTKIFITIGSILVLGFGLLLVVKLRISKMNQN